MHTCSLIPIFYKYLNSYVDGSNTNAEVFTSQHLWVGRPHSLYANITYLDGHVVSKRSWKGLDNTGSRMYSDRLMAEQTGSRNWGNIGALDF